MTPLLSAIFLILISLIGAFFDWKYRKIPNWLTFGVLFLVVGLNLINHRFEAIFYSLLGFLSGIGILLIPYLLGMMGAGDVKLLGALGSVVGFKNVIVIFILTSVCGLFLGLLWIIFRPGHFKFLITTGQALPAVDKHQKFPYGLAIFMGTIFYIITESSGYKESIFLFLPWQ